MKLIKQPTGTSCVHTCLAMLMDETPERVMAYAQNRHGFNGGLDTHNTVTLLREFKVQHFETSSLFGNQWFLLTVPSLNIVAGHHAILLHVDENGKMDSVLDPSPKKTYTPETVLCYNEVLAVNPGGMIRSWYLDEKIGEVDYAEMELIDI